MGYKLTWVDGNTKKVMLPSGKTYTKVSVKSAGKKADELHKRKRKNRYEIHNEIIKPIAQIIKNAHPERSMESCVRMAKATCLMFGHEKALESAIELYNLNN